MTFHTSSFLLNFKSQIGLSVGWPLLTNLLSSFYLAQFQSAAYLNFDFNYFS